MELLFKSESYKVIGCCMEVHKFLGKGFNEIVYKDALEVEFRNCGIEFSREKEYDIFYKNYKLPRKYIADFVLLNKIILAAKAITNLDSSHTKQVLNYLAVSKIKLGLLINFGSDSLEHKRIIL
ncbi:MAG: GxxExxY protein [Melioribacteraceae bacterium]|nr:GxxExxY protein [Melioribacteraceae bacterium]